MTVENWSPTSILIRSENPLDDIILKRVKLPRGWATMPDDSIGVVLTHTEAKQLSHDWRALAEVIESIKNTLTQLENLLR